MVRDAEICGGVLPDLRQIAQMGAQRVDNDEGVCDHEDQKDRHPGQHRLFRAPQIEQGQHANARDLDDELVVQDTGRQETEQGVRAAGHREGDRQDVIDQERRARNHAHSGGQQLAGDQVTSAAGREQLDDLGVARADDEHRQHRRRATNRLR